MTAEGQSQHQQKKSPSVIPIDASIFLRRSASANDFQDEGGSVSANIHHRNNADDRNSATIAHDTTFKCASSKSIGGGSADSNHAILLDTEQTRDVQNSLKKRRIEIYFRNRYISIGNNVKMKDKINKFIGRQQS